MFDIFKNKKVLITGHTGFKGSWLSAWMDLLGADVFGISLNDNTNPSHFLAAKMNSFIDDYKIDIRNDNLLNSKLLEIKPDFIFHLAAQPLVRKSYSFPVETFNTNIMGTVNLLESIRSFKHKCVVVIITSDKCYDNVEWEWGYKETDKLGGPDPYSGSKGAAELVINSYFKSFFSKSSKIRLGVGRAGNVIGGGDWAEDRIIPDCVKSWSNKEQVILRNPFSTRPWQHVLEPLSGYIQLASELSNDEKLNGEAFNFGPSFTKTQSVLELVKYMSLFWKNVKWEISKNNKEVFYESSLLKLNCDKALYHLKWTATLGFEKTVEFTANWYKNYYSKKENNIINYTKSQILEYSKIAKIKKLKWTIK